MPRIAVLLAVLLSATTASAQRARPGTGKNDATSALSRRGISSSMAQRLIRNAPALVRVLVGDRSDPPAAERGAPRPSAAATTPSPSPKSESWGGAARYLSELRSDRGK